MPVNTSTISASTLTGNNVQGTDIKRVGSTEKNSMDKDAFLKLLAAQAKTQDPMAPSDSTQQIAQLAQFSSLEQMLNVATEMSKLSAVTNQQSAVQLVGRDVSYKDVATGTTVAGTVERVELTKDGPRLTIAGKTGIDPVLITEVR